MSDRGCRRRQVRRSIRPPGALHRLPLPLPAAGVRVHGGAPARDDSANPSPPRSLSQMCLALETMGRPYIPSSGLYIPPLPIADYCCVLYLFVPAPGLFYCLLFGPRSESGAPSTSTAADVCQFWASRKGAGPLWRSPTDYGREACRSFFVLTGLELLAQICATFFCPPSLAEYIQKC